MKALITFLVPILAFAAVCEGYGPQTPRDITKVYGTNGVKFNMAPPAKYLNLCNIHFHKNAEHKAAGFSIPGGKGKFGGWKCNETSSLNARELSKSGVIKGCDNISPGDTIEVHWVHSSCDVVPGKGLGSCLSPKCANPQLRVETKVFLLVNNSRALNFQDFDVLPRRVDGYYQANYPKTEAPVQFRGSTTGPSYTEEKCSPLQVSWSVQPTCAMLDINSVHRWCKSNKFLEDHAHGVREIVRSPELLDQIQ